MERSQVVERIVELMEDVFDQEGIIYSDDLTADGVEDWDSLSNVRLLVLTERTFKIRFSAAEMESFKNIGELVDKVVQKLG